MGGIFRQRLHFPKSVSLLQAVWAGLPVIVTIIPSNAEWIVHRINGWLVTNDDVQGLASLIRSAVSMTKHELEVIGEININIAIDRADWQRNTNAFLSLCRNVLDNR